jgi:hypothetical protein
MWIHEPVKNRWHERWAFIALFALWAVAPGWAYALDRNIDVNAEFTTTKGDFIAVADSENNTLGDFNVAPGVEITSARDIDATAPNMNAHENAFSETRDLILNGVGLSGDTGTSPPPEGPADAGSSQKGVLNGFILQFFDNALTGC